MPDRRSANKQTWLSLKFLALPSASIVYWFSAFFMEHYKNSALFYGLEQDFIVWRKVEIHTNIGENITYAWFEILCLLNMTCYNRKYNLILNVNEYWCHIIYIILAGGVLDITKQAWAQPVNLNSAMPRLALLAFIFLLELQVARWQVTGDQVAGGQVTSGRWHLAQKKYASSCLARPYLSPCTHSPTSLISSQPQPPTPFPPLSCL